MLVYDIRDFTNILKYRKTEVGKRTEWNKEKQAK